jgi:cytochrome P450
VAQAGVSLPSASIVENARLNSTVIVPNALQGLFRRRRAAVRAATAADVDGWAVGLLSGMRNKHSGGPVWIRVMTDRALLLLTPADVHRALEGSPDPFAPDPDGKRKGMVAFQPDALTISRGEEWRNRRDFTEAVLQTASNGTSQFRGLTPPHAHTRAPAHRLADRFASVAGEEGAAVARETNGELTWDEWQGAFRRLARRVILGDAAREDEELTNELAAMMDEANGMPDRTSERYPGFVQRLTRYVDAADEGALVGMFAGAPSDERTKREGQLPHWLFATHDTLAINCFRALAAILSHPRQRGKVGEELGGLDSEPDGSQIEGLAYLGACLQDAMRLWPTTPMLSRVTLSDTDWRGETVPAGTQVLIVNTFLHRDRERVPYADRFLPEAWIDGDAAERWEFNHFSRGPQGCPGTRLALFLGKAMLASLLRPAEVEVTSPLDPDHPMPHMLDFYSLRFRLA